jgi:predicted metal-dependent hydrolase
MPLGTFRSSFAPLAIRFIRSLGPESTLLSALLSGWGSPVRKSPMQMETRAPSAEPEFSIPIRRPAGSLSRDIPRHWNGGDAFATHFLNALSSTFPFGEAFFVRSVDHYRERIEDSGLRKRIRSFAGQEGQHSRVHDDHVEMLISQGYPALEMRNRLADRISRWHNRRLPILSLAMTAALEHMTAMLARQVLSDTERRTGKMDPEMSRLWRWHALEEAEHKAVAFDVLMEVAPSYWLRAFSMVSVSLGLSVEVFDRLVYMLWKDGLLFRAQTWSRGWGYLFAERGLLREMGGDYRAWFRPTFHPNDIDDRALIETHAPTIDLEIANPII